MAPERWGRTEALGRVLIVNHRHYLHALPFLREDIVHCPPLFTSARGIERARMLVYADVCWCVLAYAEVC